MLIVSFLSDFGTSDSYVAEVKAVLLSQSPSLVLVDISHHVAPGDVRTAAFLIERTWWRFPPGTVHLVVVDPGVGSERGALAIAFRDHFFVGPDNGVFTFLVGDPGARIASLPIPPNASPTFHGRDLFAPAAASLANRGWFPTLGDPPSKEPLRLLRAEPRLESEGWSGEIIHIDRFGNLITNLRTKDVLGTALLAIHAEPGIPIFRTYLQVPVGAFLAYGGSGGTLEIAVRDGSAADRLQAKVGDRVLAKQGR